MAYIAPIILRSYLNTPVEDDALLTHFALAAEQCIENVTSRRFKVETDTTRYFTVRDACNGTLYFDEDLAQTPTTVTNGDGTVITSAQYVLVDRNRPPYYAIRLKSTTGLFWTYLSDPEDAIAITGRWGWSTTLPADVEQMCIRLAAYFYRQKNISVLEIFVDANSQLKVPHGFPSDLKEMLDFYRKRVR
jgi:hypothetical protein